MLSQTAPEGPFLIQGNATAYTVADLHPAILDYLDRATSPVVDLSGVLECDTLGLQLLLATQQTAIRRGLAFSFQSIPESVQLACEVRGLTLEPPQDAPLGSIPQKAPIQ